MAYISDSTCPFRQPNVSVNDTLDVTSLRKRNRPTNYYRVEYDDIRQLLLRPLWFQIAGPAIHVF